MTPQRLDPLRGLLAGLLALTVFASLAVAMTAGGSSRPAAVAAPAVPAQALVTADDDGFRGEGRRGDDGTRISLRGDDDFEGRGGGRGR